MSDIHVAVAIIKNHLNEVLVSLRPDHVHQGGLWEFPGGKLEKEETVVDALKREISEELDIKILHASAYKTIRHSYSDKNVVLDVYLVDQFQGAPRGVEGQLVKWQSIGDLKQEDFPAANRFIIQSLQLPDKYMITGEFENPLDFLKRLEHSLNNGISLVQLRCKKCTAKEYLLLAEQAQELCNEHGAQLLLNTNPSEFKKTKAQGLHLSSQQLHSNELRPVADGLLLSVSCHTVDDIEKAKQLNADIILLSPVKETRSHPGVKGIGWAKFSQLILDSETPVYALGGMSAADIEHAKSAGAQGVAAISSFWSGV